MDEYPIAEFGVLQKFGLVIFNNMHNKLFSVFQKNEATIYT